MNYLHPCITKIKYYLLRQRIHLRYLDLKALKNRVNLNYFRAEIGKGSMGGSELRNLGDCLSPVIVEYMLSKKGLSLASTSKKTRHLYAIGSILFLGYQNATVWGSGMLTKPSAIVSFVNNRLFRKLDIRCVRGPLTARELRKIGFRCPEFYGDPACLLPLVYFPEKKKELEYIVIPHMKMEEQLHGVIPEENIVSMKTDDYRFVVDKICSAKKVIASSLHGIILAESYGIPAVFYQDRPMQYNFKYADWYESTGRKKMPVTSDLKEAISMEVNYVPDLSRMQKGLIEAFPYDLWSV